MQENSVVHNTHIENQFYLRVETSVKIFKDLNGFKNIIDVI